MGNFNNDEAGVVVQDQLLDPSILAGEHRQRIFVVLTTDVPYMFSSARCQEYPRGKTAPRIPLGQAHAHPNLPHRWQRAKVFHKGLTQL